jgi:lipopolysaccharide export system permease protein
MRIIDRYLLRQFAQVFAVCLVSITGLYVVIDAFGHLDELMTQASKRGGLLSLLAEYYGYRSLVFFERTSGVLALIAAMFTVTWIQRHNELAALLAAGIAKLRVLAPILLSAVAVSLIAVACRELVLPRVRDHLAANPQVLTGSEGRDVRARYDQRTGIFLDAQRVVVSQSKLDKPRFRLPSSLGQYGTRIEAGTAHYQQATATHPAGYLLQGVSKPADLAQRASLSSHGIPVVLTPKDAPWLKTDQCFVASDVEIEMLDGDKTWEQFASTWQLRRGLANPSLDFGANVRVAIHTRLVQPLLDTTLLFLGLPLILARDNRNMFLAIGLCLLVVAFFMFVVVMCQFLGTASLVSASLAAWLPLMIFVPAAVAASGPLTG